MEREEREGGRRQKREGKHMSMEAFAGGVNLGKGGDRLLTASQKERFGC